MLVQLGPERPLYRAVFNAIRHAIVSGQLVPGSKIPGTRTLARQLGRSRTVVQAAFEQLAAEGYIRSAVGSGSTVASIGGANVRRSSQPVSGPISAYALHAERLAPHRSQVQDFRGNVTTVDFRYATFAPDGITSRAWARAISRAARQTQSIYPDAEGLPSLRIVLCEYLRRHRGLAAEPEDIIIVGGSQQALDLAVRAICGSGTAIGIEDPHYQGARQVLQAAGARLIACAVGEDGFDIGRHQRALRDARAIYVTPSLQFPTGTAMSIERRMQLLHWARSNQAWIIEDDYDAEHQQRANAFPALQGLDKRGAVIYIGTVVRTLSPGLRLGYMVVPSALRECFKAMKWLTDRGSSALEQRALLHFMQDGGYERAQRRASRQLASARLALSQAMLNFGATEVTWACTGSHTFLRLPAVAGAETDAFIAQAVRRGVRPYSAAPYYLKPPLKASLVCGVGSLSPTEIHRGIERLAKTYEAWSRARL